MKIDEIKKKDWQVLTANAHIQTLSYLMFVLDNQAVIISELKKIPLKQVINKMNEYQKEYDEKVNELVKKNTPNYDFNAREY